MNAVGVFKEFSPHSGPTVPSIHEFVGQLSVDTSALVSSYLKRGVPLNVVMEATQDPLDKDVYISGGPSLLSDGVWVWRYDLAHYVNKYRVGLPEVFVDHVRKQYDANFDQAMIRDRYEEIEAAYFRAQDGN